MGRWIIGVPEILVAVSNFFFFKKEKNKSKPLHIPIEYQLYNIQESSKALKTQMGSQKCCKRPTKRKQEYTKWNQRQ